MDVPDISVIMPCHNRASGLSEVLKAYDRQRGEEQFEIIAIDDASTDATHNVLSTFKAARFEIRIERLTTNQGPAAARNMGIARAKAPLILFVGDDIVPDVNLISGHVAAHRRYPQREVAILGRVEWPKDISVNTLMAHIDGIGAQQFSYHYMRDEQEYDFRHLYTANVSLKRDFLFLLDRWFDTDFRYAAFEDAELAYRLSELGLRIIYAAALTAYHYHYHNIWSFSDRQYKMGLMACVFADKHPEIIKIIVGKRWRFQKILWRFMGTIRPNSSQFANWLETQILHLLNAYEWTDHRLTDSLYLGVLNYYYYKGLIYGTYGESKLCRSVHNIYAQRVLVSLLSRFLRQCEQIGEELPEEYGPWLLNALRRIEQKSLLYDSGS